MASIFFTKGFSPIRGEVQKVAVARTAAPKDEILDGIHLEGYISLSATCINALDCYEIEVFTSDF